MIKLTNINMSFNDELVLKELNFEIMAGEVVYIKGANGSGKSTLLKIMAKLLVCDAGEVECADNVNLGALIENPAFIENETALFNLEFLASLKSSFDKEKVTSFLTLFSLDPKSRKVMKKYSVGMRQKAGIIQAIMEDQNVILFDEPTRGLDEESVKVFVNIVEQKRKEGKAIVICAHDGIDSIDFTRKLVLKNGSLHPIVSEK